MMRLREPETLPQFLSAADVDEYVRKVSDTIYDPCGMAMGVNIGINEMGLIRTIEITPAGDGCWSVHVLLRLTAPGCEYFFAFKDNLEQGLLPHPQLKRVEVEWDPTLDWTPEALSESARHRMEARRRELWQGKHLQQQPPGKTVVRLEAV